MPHSGILQDYNVFHPSVLYDVVFIIRGKTGRLETRSDQIRAANFFGALAVAWLSDKINPTEVEDDVIEITISRVVELKSQYG